MALTDLENPELTDSQEKEKFDIGVKDDELLRQVDSWLEESNDLYSILERIWQDNIDYYKGKQTGVERIAGKESKVVENRIWMAVETMIPIATARLPEIEIVGQDDNEKSQMESSELQKIITHQLERVGVQEKSERFARDMLVKRYGVFKPHWDKPINDVGLKLVDPKRIKMPKFGYEVGDRPIIEEMELSFTQAKDVFGEAEAKNLFKTNAIQRVISKKHRKPTRLVLEVWSPDSSFVAWISGRTVIKKQKNPYFDFKNSNVNHFDRPRKPYIIKSLFQTDESLIGDTDYIQQVKYLQDNINTRKRQIENITGLVGNPFLLIDSEVMSEEEAAQITNEAGQIVYGPGVADPGKVRFEAPGQVPQYLFTDLETSRQEFDNIWGIHSTTRGEREGRETLGGRKLLRQADLGRIDGVARQIERALGEVGDWFTQLIKLFYTESRTFAILGEEGVQMIRDFKGNQLSPVKLMVKPGSTLPRDEVTIHGEGLQLWQLQAIGVKTLYKMLRLPNIPEAIEDYANTFSGNILKGAAQQGGGGGAIPGLQAPEGLNQSPQEQVAG